MAPCKNIALLFVAAVLLSGLSATAASATAATAAASPTATSALPVHEGAFGFTQFEPESPHFPTGRPEGLGNQRQGRSLVDLVRVLTLPNAKEGSVDERTGPRWVSENRQRRALSICLRYSGTLHQSLSIRELLFPFHHFL
jgi:hypothetical protein